LRQSAPITCHHQPPRAHFAVSPFSPRSAQYKFSGGHNHSIRLFFSRITESFSQETCLSRLAGLGMHCAVPSRRKGAQLMPDPYPDTACRKRGILVTQGMRITVAFLSHWGCECRKPVISSSGLLAGRWPRCPNMCLSAASSHMLTGVRCSQAEPHAHLHDIDIRPARRLIHMGFRRQATTTRPTSPGQGQRLQD
jgi:hypothetical protein